LERCFIFSNVGKNLHKVVTSTIDHTFKQTGISTQWKYNNHQKQQYTIFI